MAETLAPYTTEFQFLLGRLETRVKCLQDKALLNSGLS